MGFNIILDLCTGKRFLYWRGPHAKLVSKDPGLAKEVLLSQYEFFQRHPQDIKMLSNFVGMGLDNLTGEKWATERRTLNPFFYHDPLKVTRTSSFQISSS